MRSSDYCYLAFLVSLAVHIWLRDPSWQTRAGDTWPILGGIPLFILFRRPWTFAQAQAERRFSLPGALGAVTLYLLGVLSNLTLLLALAWTLSLRAWLIHRTDARQTASETTKLLALPFLSFPWVSTDLNSLGWAFRWSGAAAVDYLFSALQFDVVRQGTFLWVQGKAMSIEAACSGLNGLQSMLMAGTTLAYLKLRHTNSFFCSLPLLVAAAWLANTIRIIILAFIAVGGRWDMQNKLIHGLAGWGSLCLAFGLCWLIFTWQEPKTKTPWNELARPHRA